MQIARWTLLTFLRPRYRVLLTGNAIREGARLACVVNLIFALPLRTNIKDAHVSSLARRIVHHSSMHEVPFGAKSTFGIGASGTINEGVLAFSTTAHFRIVILSKATRSNSTCEWSWTFPHVEVYLWELRDGLVLISTLDAIGASLGEANNWIIEEGGWGRGRENGTALVLPVYFVIGRWTKAVRWLATYSCIVLKYDAVSSLLCDYRCVVWIRIASRRSCDNISAYGSTAVEE
jgi:hypothetical protein